MAAFRSARVNSSTEAEVVSRFKGSGGPTGSSSSSSTSMAEEAAGAAAASRRFFLSVHMAPILGMRSLCSRARISGSFIIDVKNRLYSDCARGFLTLVGTNECSHFGQMIVGAGIFRVEKLSYKYQTNKNISWPNLLFWKRVIQKLPLSRHVLRCAH